MKKERKKFEPGIEHLTILILIGVFVFPLNALIGVAIPLVPVLIALFVKFSSMTEADWYRWLHEGRYGELNEKQFLIWTKMKTEELEKRVDKAQKN